MSVVVEGPGLAPERLEQILAYCAPAPKGILSVDVTLSAGSVVTREALLQLTRDAYALTPRPPT